MLYYVVAWTGMVRREEGQDLAEYALLIGLIALALFFVLGALGGGIGDTFKYILNRLNAAGPFEIQI